MAGKGLRSFPMISAVTFDALAPGSARGGEAKRPAEADGFLGAVRSVLASATDRGWHERNPRPEISSPRRGSLVNSARE